jgi:predicted O-linked N-acetylglucosamine transferase (SPINDLY family)
MGDVPPELQTALAHHRAGRLAEARTAYSAILARDPDQVDALHLLGTICHRAGELDEAVRLIEQALLVKPGFAAAYVSLGDVRLSQGKPHQAIPMFRAAVTDDPSAVDARVKLADTLQGVGWLDEAVAAYRAALALQPDALQVLVNLGGALHKLGRPDQAITPLRRAIELQPDRPESHNNLACALRDLGHFEDAVASYRRALAVRPGYALAHANLVDMMLSRAAKHQGAGRLAEARAIYAEALAEVPDDADAMHRLGLGLAALGEKQEAVRLLARAVALKPENLDHLRAQASLLRELSRYTDAEPVLQQVIARGPSRADAHNDLGLVYFGLRRLEQAVESFRTAIRIDPSFPAPRVNLGVVLEQMARSEEAAEAYRRAIDLDPNLAEAYNNLARLLTEQDKRDEAVAIYRRALEIGPHARIHSNLIFAMDEDDRTSPADARAERQRWYETNRARDAARFRTWSNSRDSDRKLRIGYVSADFCLHSSSFMFVPLIAGHDRSLFEAVCYSETRREDDRTALFRASASDWRTSLGMSDPALAHLIREDGIDILVDLSGHTAGNRLPVFTAKPAPVQVTVFAAHGTGIPEIDYLLADPVLVTTEERQWFAEQVVDLPCFQTYEAPSGLPEVGPLPAASHGAITFGCLNRFSKVSDRVLAAWARILSGCPGSRLLLKDRVFSDEAVCRATLARLARQGIQPERVVLQGATPSREHLAAHGAVDLALDPFPINGGISTLEALWMGAPVLTQYGDRAAVGRVGASILGALGLTELVARNDDDYVARALRLAGDRRTLAELRRGLRSRMRACSVGNPALYVAAVEAILRAAWRRWCATR